MREWMSFCDSSAPEEMARNYEAYPREFYFNRREWEHIQAEICNFAKAIQVLGGDDQKILEAVHEATRKLRETGFWRRGN